MTDQFELAQTTPHDEPCSQVGSDNYLQKARLEARAFINQLIRENGEPPAGAQFKITRNPHDFGTYLDVALTFDPEDESQCNYVFGIERKVPRHWDAEALTELQDGNYEFEERI